MTTRAAWGLVTLLGLTSPALAEDCRLALVLALDVSASVDVREDTLQRQGLASALLAPEVVRAFLRDEPIALFVFEWASASFQLDITPDWQIVRSEEDLIRVATAITDSRGREGSQRAMAGATGVGAALLHAAVAFGNGPDCLSRTVDISGDGENNDGFLPEVAYRSPLLDDVTVNALVVDRLRVKPIPPEQIRLVAWFKANVLRGPGAFWVLASGYEDYERAMRIKLLRELDVPMVSGLPSAGGGA